MAEKPKAGASKKPPPKRRMTDAEQRERFIKAARELGVDESGEEFERLFRKVAPPKRAPSRDDSSR